MLPEVTTPPDDSVPGGKRCLQCFTTTCSHVPLLRTDHQMCYKQEDSQGIVPPLTAGDLTAQGARLTTEVLGVEVYQRYASICPGVDASGAAGGKGDVLGGVRGRGVELKGLAEPAPQPLPHPEQPALAHPGVVVEQQTTCNPTV